jgi:hypothetical protein
LVIPEQENAQIAPDLSGDAVHIIRSYVASGGGLIINADNERGAGVASFLSRVFGISVTEGANPGTTTKQGAAAGTAFASGPATLPREHGTNYMTGLSVRRRSTQARTRRS